MPTIEVNNRIYSIETEVDEYIATLYAECEKLKEQAKLVTPAQNEMDILKTKLEFYEMAKPITEHPDVQKLIAKMVVLQAEYDTLKASHAKLVEENRWIPVTEKLPEKTGEYLVFPYIEHCSVLWYQDGWFWYDHQDDAISDSIGYCEDPIPEITHWKSIILPQQALILRRRRRYER